MKKTNTNLITSRIHLGILLVLGFAICITFGSIFWSNSKAQDFSTETKAEKPQQQSDELDKSFSNLIGIAQEKGAVRVIIGLRLNGFKPIGELDEPKREKQKTDIKIVQSDFLERFGSYNLKEVKQFEFMPFLAAEVDAGALENMRNDPQVVSIQEDEAVAPALAQSVPLVGAPAAWNAGFSGSGWSVAVLDSGVDKFHSFLSGKVISEACFSTNFSTNNVLSVCPGGVTQSTASNSGVNCSSSISGCDHGTHVAGIAAGNSASSSGVARNANIIAVQVFSRFSNQPDCGSRPAPCALTYGSDQIRGLERVLTLSGSMNIAAVNMSLGGGRHFANCDVQEASRKLAIDNLRSVGIATIIASGNESYTNSMAAPACISTAISVGNSGDGSTLNGNTAGLNQVMDDSNSASFLNLLAPGRWINSSVPGGEFRNFNGTSMATPHVAGAWAVLKQKKPNATVTEILNALTSTGLPITDIRNGITKPRIRVDAALQALDGGGTCPAVTISPGQNINGTLSTSDCFYTGTNRYVDIYTFNGTAGQMISISMNSTAFDTRLYLINSSNQIIAEDDDGGDGTNSRIPADSGFFTLPAAGSYLIYATSFSENATGAYSFNLTANSCPNPSPISFSQTVNGNISTSDCVDTGKYYDAYTFSGTAGQQIAISQSSTAFDTYLYLLNSSGQVIVENDDSGGVTNSRIPVTSGFFSLPATGNYTIRASTYSVGATGTYSLSLTVNGGGSLQFNSPTYTVNENAGTATVTVSRTGSSSGAVSINYATSNGTAVAGQDYSSASGTLNFANGVTSQSFTVSIINDLLVEGNETINLTLNNPTGGSVLGTPSTAILTIIDNDTCNYTVTQTGTPEIPASGSTRSFSVTVLSGCTWSATSNVSWIIVTSGSSGSGNGTVTVSILLNTGPPRPGTVTIAGQSFPLFQQGVIPPSKKPFDFDGDGRTDYGVFRPSNGSWYLQNSTSGFFGQQFGISIDKITPADYDGDGRTDIAVFRNGNWYLQRSQLGFTAVQFGQTGDIPMPADYDGDGKADIAVFRPSNGSWYLLMSNQGFAGVQFGQNGDKPVPADYDGDGKADLAVYRPLNGAWYLLQSSQGFAAISFGIAADKPVPADYDGDGKADIAVFRSGNWYLLQSQLGFAAVTFGIAEDKLVVGNYDGDGKADIAVWRPSTGSFYVLRSQAGYTGYQFGQNVDVPVASAFIQ